MPKLKMSGIKVRHVLRMVERIRGERVSFGEVFQPIPFSMAEGLAAIREVEALRV